MPILPSPKTARISPLLVTVLCWIVVCDAKASTYAPSKLVPPKPPREFRAAWVASVANIDWPSKPDLTTAEQKAELIAIFNAAVDLNLNAIVFQVRPACDALYASQLEPWSYYLTGIMGKAPAPFYDPLAFAVEEAHKRGLELHAWFNPYRAHHPSDRSPISANHISKTRPHLVRQYGDLLWLDPGEREVQDHSLSVVMDVVKRYDIDGVHFDDYFYPYKKQDARGKDIDFPDDASWKRFGKGDRDDWRRENVNTFVERVYRSIKAAKPWVRFGISPFGIWRPGNPQPIEGLDAYDELYADSRKWLANGWGDYFAPQLYWAIDAPAQSFPVLLDWWAKQNQKGRLLMPGLDTTKTRNQWKPDEIIKQIELTRKEAGVAGHIHWNMKSLMRNAALTEALKFQVYKELALIPATTWLDKSPPTKPDLSVRPAVGEPGTTVHWRTVGKEKAFVWLLQTRTGNTWTSEVLAGNTNSRELKAHPEIIAVTAVDRSGNASPAAVMARNK